MDDEYCGIEHRLADRRACPMDSRIAEIERNARQNAAEARKTAMEVKHITECLNGYKAFIEILREREEQKVRLREKLIERGIAAVVFSVAGAALMLLWVGIIQWIKDVR